MGSYYIATNMARRYLFALIAAVGLGVAFLAARPAAPSLPLPARLADREFWRLASDSSEPDGYFRSDTLTSNELLFQHVIPDLVKRTERGAVYLGVGPEQNFTYIAAVRPAMAIVFDIRRGNMLVQLMYKALFELAKDRIDFVSMLFSRPRPTGLGSSPSVVELFAAFGGAASDEAFYHRNLESIQRHLTRTHGLPLSPRDLDGIEYAYHAFYSRGFAVRYSPTYADLMTQTDSEGVARSYLASEASFTAIKDLESRNLLIPVVGDFAGPKAIRAIGAYLKAHDARVTAFYLSNVEQYLYPDGKWTAFCRNVATLPLDASSTFIRSSSGRGVGVGFVSSLGAMAEEVKSCE
jgi:hypothetical protein